MDVSGRVFRLGEETYISMCVTNVPANLGEAKQTLCSEMLHWDEYRREKGINDSVPLLTELFNPRHGDSVPRSTYADDSGTYVPRSVAIDGRSAGHSCQNYCAEMQHWDDLRQATGALNPLESMAAMFKPYERQLQFLAKTSRGCELSTYTACSVALLHGGSDSQPFCTEMQHWDDHCAVRGTPNAPTMASLFKPITP